MKIQSSILNKITAFTLLSISISVLAENIESIPELKGYKKVSLPTPVPIFSDNFEQGTKGWNLPKREFSFEVRKGIGRSYSKALFRHSESKKDYTVARRKIHNLVPGKQYELWFWTKNIKGPLAGSACVEFYNGNKYAGGSYNPEIIKTPDGWQRRRYRFIAPAKGVTTHIGLYVLQENNNIKIREAVWDDLTITLASPKSAVLYPVNFQNSQIDDKGTVSVGSALFGELENCQAQLSVLLEANGNRKLITTNKNGIYSAEFGKLPSGQIKIRAWLLNNKEKTIEAKHEFFCYRNDLKPVRGSVWLDNHGRTIMDGKPGLPIGVYTMDLTENDLKVIADCGFDFIVPYTITLNKRPFGSKNPNSYQRIVKALDNCLKYNLRVALTLLNEQSGFEGNPDANAIYKKMITTVRNHPGLFCYFTADEVTLDKLANKQRRRALIASLDPYHPVFVNDYVPERFAHQRWICDVFGYDIYPVTEDKNTSLAASSIELNRLDKMSPFPLWFIPQAWQSWLTGRQMLAHTLSGAVYGSKGFVLYSYNTNTNKDAAVRKKLLPSMKKTVSQLRELEPWIISTVVAPKLTITPAPTSSKKNMVHAKAFRDEKGRDAIVIVSDGPATANATLQFSGSTQLVSKYGNTINMGKGKYFYKANGINCDVLLPATAKK